MNPYDDLASIMLKLDYFESFVVPSADRAKHMMSGGS